MDILRNPPVILLDMDRNKNFVLNKEKKNPQKTNQMFYVAFLKVLFGEGIKCYPNI